MRSQSNRQFSDDVTIFHPEELAELCGLLEIVGDAALALFTGEPTMPGRGQMELIQSPIVKDQSLSFQCNFVLLSWGH